MRALIFATAALMAAGVVSAQAQDASTSDQAGGSTASAAQAYVTAAGQSDQFEITEGKMAERMGQTAAVRSFGRQMINDHSKSTRMVMGAALASGLPQTPPPPLNADQQQMVAQLQSTPASSFDQTYVQQQLQAHRQALMLQQNYAQSGGDPNLKGAATKIVPVVQHHLAMLETLKTDM